MKITVLMENTTDQSCMITEHGLSLYIEANGHRILFDTGQSSSFVENAKQLGVDLAEVDMVILSHGHYDHGGGLMAFLEVNNKAYIYINENAFGQYYSGETKEIGIAPELKTCSQVVITGDNFVLDEGLELHTCNEQPRLYETNAYGLYKSINGRLTEDDFLHEQYLFIKEAEKEVLISGCSHKGILNIEKWFQPDVLIGGFHFKKLEPLGTGRHTLDKAADELLKYNTVYYTCHCTGVEQYEYLKEQMKEQLHYIKSGDQLMI